jgi:pantoate--beta-alanine ligase
MRAPEIIRTPQAMRERAEGERRAGRRIAFVPTMGFLHRGHVALLEEGRRRGDVLVMSIFVNPKQFGPSEDFARYPRDFEGDLAKASAAGTDIVYAPDEAAMYPPGFQTSVDVEELQRGLCGDRRPGHFRGVATVVLKLLHAVGPHVVLLGEKDYQQLQVVRRMTRDLDMDAEVVSVPTWREPDGLAMSSRNAYLTPDERVRATSLNAGLRAAEAAVSSGVRDAAALARTAEQVILAARPTRIDYVEIRDAETLEPVREIDRPAVLALAVFFGKTRLIDNLVLKP